MYIKLNVNFPDNIAVASIPLLERALPPRKVIEKFPKNIILEDVNLDAVDTRTKANAMRDEPMDEDPDEPRVQCANQ